MLRSLFGFATLAVVALVGLKLIFALLGGILGLLGTVLWFAFLGWIFYVLLRIIAPDTAARLREMISGKPAY